MQKQYNKFFVIILILAMITHCNANAVGNICNTDFECDAPYINCRNGTCTRKKFWKPQLMEIIGTLTILVLLMLATAAGIGGGAFLVPGLIFFYKFSVKEAVSIANTLIVFSSFTKIIIGFRSKNPVIPHKALIDYNTILVLGMFVIGSLLGALIADILAEQIQLGVLFLIVLFSLYKSFKKTVQLWKKETKALKLGDKKVFPMKNFESQRIKKPIEENVVEIVECCQQANSEKKDEELAKEKDEEKEIDEIQKSEKEASKEIRPNDRLNNLQNPITDHKIKPSEESYFIKKDNLKEESPENERRLKLSPYRSKLKI